VNDAGREPLELIERRIGLSERRTNVHGPLRPLLTTDRGSDVVHRWPPRTQFDPAMAGREVNSSSRLLPGDE
jgi:hypothetical protein